MPLNWHWLLKSTLLSSQRTTTHQSTHQSGPDRGNRSKLHDRFRMVKSGLIRIALHRSRFSVTRNADKSRNRFGRFWKRYLSALPLRTILDQRRTTKFDRVAPPTVSLSAASGPATFYVSVAPLTWRKLPGDQGKRQIQRACRRSQESSPSTSPSAAQVPQSTMILLVRPLLRCRQWSSCHVVKPANARAKVLRLRPLPRDR